MRTERPSLMLPIVNRLALQERVRRVMTAQYGDDAGEGVKVGKLLAGRNPKASTRWHDRDLVLIDTEGIYYWADEVGLISVPVLNSMQESVVKVGTNIVADLITTDESDLAEHVNTFGDRLESNFVGAFYMVTVGREVQ